MGNPLAFLLSSSNNHGSRRVVPLLSQIDIKGSSIIGDKAYGAKEIRDFIYSRNLPIRFRREATLTTRGPVDWHTYKERHLVERFFQKLKWFRRIFTRYDKLDASFLRKH